MKRIPGGRRGGLLIAFGALAIALAAAAAGVFANRGFSDEVGGADPDDPVQVAQGREVYTAACAACHGERLEGQPDWRVRLADGRLPAPPHDETGHTWHHPDFMLFEMTKQGIEAFAPAGYESDMPGFADQLSDAEIWAVLAFIKSRWPAEVRARQRTISERSRAQ